MSLSNENNESTQIDFFTSQILRSIYATVEDYKPYVYYILLESKRTLKIKLYVTIVNMIDVTAFRIKLLKL